jgi:MarR family transcriptional regulator, organic hydroperoxide resistance regulator
MSSNVSPVPRSIVQELKQTRPFPSKSQEAAIALLRTADVVRRLIGAVVEPRGITTQQYNVLRILRGAGERGLPTLEIAERMVETTPGITRLIDRLETKKLVWRERCTTDRRQVFCRITAPGLTLLAALDAPILHATDSALGSLKKTELASLIDLLDRTREQSNEQFIERRRSQ